MDLIWKDFLYCFRDNMRGEGYTAPTSSSFAHMLRTATLDHGVSSLWLQSLQPCVPSLWPHLWHWQTHLEQEPALGATLPPSKPRSLTSCPHSQSKKRACLRNLLSGAILAVPNCAVFCDGSFGSSDFSVHRVCRKLLGFQDDCGRR